MQPLSSSRSKTGRPQPRYLLGDLPRTPRPLSGIRLDVSAGDLERCHSLLRKGSKTFSVASRLFPKDVRDRATILYAFCRVTDDRVDDDPNASLRTIDMMRSRVERAYDGRPEDDPVDRAFASLLAAIPIPKLLPLALLEGMEWDLTGKRYETVEDLYAYAARVAGTVGAMMTLVMGARGEEVLSRACDLGVAMQLTNVARDVGEDARRGRLYLPRAWMNEAGVDADSFLAAPKPSRELGVVVSKLLGEADVLYRRADHGVSMLPRACRVAVRAARLVYADIGRVVELSGCDSVTSRAVVSKWRKLSLVARSLGAPFASASPLGEPALPATRSLVAACGAGP